MDGFLVLEGKVVNGTMMRMGWMLLFCYYVHGCSDKDVVVFELCDWRVLKRKGAGMPSGRFQQCCYCIEVSTWSQLEVGSKGFYALLLQSSIIVLVCVLSLVSCVSMGCGESSSIKSANACWSTAIIAW